MKTLRRGDRGAEVKTLQEKLCVYADGIFGAITEDAVRQYQKSKRLTVDGIAGPKTWAALGVSANMRGITEIIVHCTATPEGEDFTVQQIRAAHLARGFSDIGYHYVIYRDGSIHTGRDESVSGAHCTGHNLNSIGVCYVGGCPARSTKNWENQGKDTRTGEQKLALVKLLVSLKKRYPGAKIYGHRDFANKACPSFDAKKEYMTL